MDSQIRQKHYIIDITQMLGKGAFGIVYACKSEIFKDKDLCVKIVSCKAGMFSIAKEVQLLEVLQKVKNPNLITIYDIVQDEKQIYIFMDRCKGGDMKSLITEYYLKKKQFSLEQIVDMIRQIIFGYQTLIQNKIIHRDLKPANILIELQPQDKITLKLTDFGLGKILDDISIKQYMTRVGTPAYMSPQIVLADRFSAKCDVFSLGIIIYELAFLELPSQGMNHQIRNYFQKSLKTKPFVCPNLHQQQPAELKQFVQDLINKTLSFDEEKRPSWDDLYKLDKLQTIVQPPSIEIKQKQEEPDLLYSLFKYNRIQGNDRYYDENQFFKFKQCRQQLMKKDEFLRKSYQMVYMMISKAQLVQSLQNQFKLIIMKYFPQFKVFYFQLILTSCIGYIYKLLENAIGFCNQQLGLINDELKKQFENSLLEMTSRISHSKDQEVQEIKKFVQDFFLKTKDIFQEVENELIKLKLKNQYPMNIDKFFRLIIYKELSDFGIYAKWFHFFWNQHLRELLIYDQSKQADNQYQFLLILIERFLNLETDYPLQKYQNFDESQILLYENQDKYDLDRQIKIRVYI